MSRCDDARQMLLEAQVRLARESLRVRPDCSEKTVYFLIDLVLPYGVRAA
jgi:hypothetical protein